MATYWNLAILRADLLSHAVAHEMHAVRICLQTDLYNRELIQLFQSNRFILLNRDSAKKRLVTWKGHRALTG